MPLTPQGQAMLQGMQQGNQQAQSIIPSTFQPQGRAQGVNPWKGFLDLICSKLLEISDQVGQQGQAYDDEKVELLKHAYTLAKLNQRLTDIAQGDVKPTQ
jgi:hypothetical protein